MQNIDTFEQLLFHSESEIKAKYLLQELIPDDLKDKVLSEYNDHVDDWNRKVEGMKQDAIERGDWKK
jgi:uncharacterized protein YjcR